MINFEFYKVFYYCGKYLNFSKAGEKLFVSQSAVSQSIKSLEGQLDVSLFIRNGRHLQLTEEGKQLYVYVEQAFNYIKSGESYIASLKSLDSGTIYLGASDTINKYFLIPYLKAFNNHYPKVKISINNRPSSKSVQLIEKGSIDLAIINVNPSLMNKNLIIRDFADDENVLVYHPDHYSFESPISFDEAFSHPIICLEQGATTRVLLDSFLKDYGISFMPNFEFGSLDVILEMAANGMGIGYVSKTIASDYINKGIVKIVPLQKKLPPNQVAIITSRHKPLSIATEKFLNILLNHQEG